MKPTPGARTVAMLDATDTPEKVVRIFGHGTYVGDEIPDANAGAFAALCREAGRPNPKIVLDDGAVVWGGECWWAPEEGFAARFAGYRIEQVDIAKVRSGDDR